MHVDSYSFGRIQVSGKIYESDLIIFPDRVMSSWWRKEGHRLCLDDLRPVLEEMPATIIVGTGYSGAMRVPEELVRELERRGIEVLVAPTSRACEAFNELVKEKAAVAALHLTC